MIDAFVFDIGNVLLSFDFSAATERVRAHCSKTIEVEAIEALKNRYEDGRIRREQFQSELIELLGYTGTLPDLTSAWQEIFTENEPMIGLVHRLHGRYPLYLLSNTSDLHIDYIFRTYPVFSLFDDAVYSFSTRCSKPHPEIFEAAIQKFGVNAKNTIYIDDLLPNVEAASAAGFEAIHYHPDHHAAFEQRLRELQIEV